MHSEYHFIKFIYDKSPYIFKNFLLSFYSLLKYKERYGKIYKSYFEFLQKAQYWPNDKLREYQILKIKKFLIFAYLNTKFYRKQFENYKFNPFNFEDLDQLKNLPSLTKKEVRNNYYDILPTKWLKNQKIIYKKTSGTTGTPLNIPKTVDAEQKSYAIRDFVCKIFTGRRFKDVKVAYLAGHLVKNVNKNNPPFWAYDILTKTLYFSSYHLSYTNLKYYVEKILKFKPEMIAGYPSSLNLIAEFIIVNNIKIYIPYIWTASETLLLSQEKNLLKAFNGKINNWYGNTEGISGSFVCPNGKCHLLQFDNYIYKDKHYLYLTNFENYAFPLINYIVDDDIIFDKYYRCSCGIIGDIIQKIEGRKEDYIITKDYKKVGRLDHIFKDINNIIEAQIYQDKIGEAEFRIVKTNDFSPDDEKKIIDNARSRLGNNFKIKIKFVKQIPRTKTGKFRFVFSKINLNEINI